MQNSVGIVRTEELLSEGITELEKLKEAYSEVKADGASQYNPGWDEALALRNLLVTSETVARAALMREESRGAHTRVDFPEEEDEWLEYNVVASKGDDGTMRVEKVAREKADSDLERIVNLTIEELEAEVAADT